MRGFKAKKLLRLVVCLALVLSLFAAAACGGKKDPGTTTTDPTEYTVTFDTQGGSEVEPIVVKANEKAEKPDNPTKAGHIFKGWYLDLSDTESGSFLFDDTPITSDITLYALWQIRQYTVSYQDPDGNALSEIAGGTYDWGSLLPEPDDSAYQKEGYLLKWYTSNGAIWDFETSTVTTNTVLTYRYVTTKYTFNGSDIAEDFYPTYDKIITDAESCQETYLEESNTVLYTYKATSLQQVVLNVELPTLNYDSVTIVGRSTDKNGDASKGGTFSQVRAYIKTDVGGDISYNDEPSSGYSPSFYYIQSTGTNSNLVTSTETDGWITWTFDLASLKFWNEGTRLDAFAFGFVSTTLGIELKSIVFNEVDPTKQFDVAFVDSVGNTLSDTQTVTFNTCATKPAVPTDTDYRRYTGEWLDASGNVFDFSTRIRSNVTLTPEYTIVNKYSWTGEEIAADFKAVYNANTANAAAQYAHDGNSVFTYNNGVAANSLEQIVIDNLSAEIGDYKYLTVKMRTVDFNGFAYNSAGEFALIRIYVLTDLGGSVLKNTLEDKDSYYYNFNGISYTTVTTPVDVSAKSSEGWITVTIDLTALAYYANGTTLNGFTIGTTTGTAIKAIEVSEISLSTELAARESYTVSFVDKDGNAIEAIPDQSVLAGKAAELPDSSLVPAVTDAIFDKWVDANEQAFSATSAIEANTVYKATYIDSFVGTKISYTGQSIIDNFTSSYERYGNTLKYQNQLTLSDAGNAVADYVTTVKANKALTGLDLGIHIHEGSTLTIKFSSDQWGTYGYAALKIAFAFRGEDPATTILSTASNAHYINDFTFTAGSTSGERAKGGISYTVDENGIITVVFDLYTLAQSFTVADGVDINYIEAFTFLTVEAKTGAAAAQTNAATFTYYLVEFDDVTQNKQASAD